MIIICYHILADKKREERIILSLTSHRKKGFFLANFATTVATYSKSTFTFLRAENFFCRICQLSSVFWYNIATFVTKYKSRIASIYYIFLWHIRGATATKCFSLIGYNNYTPVSNSAPTSNTSSVLISHLRLPPNILFMTRLSNSKKLVNKSSSTLITVVNNK